MSTSKKGNSLSRNRKLHNNILPSVSTWFHQANQKRAVVAKSEHRQEWVINLLCKRDLWLISSLKALSQMINNLLSPFLWVLQIRIRIKLTKRRRSRLRSSNKPSQKSRSSRSRSSIHKDSLMIHQQISYAHTLNQALLVLHCDQAFCKSRTASRLWL